MNDERVSRSVVREMTVLLSCTVKDFVVERLVAVGANGMVLAVKCIAPGLPDPSKLFALKGEHVLGGGLSTTSLL